MAVKYVALFKQLVLILNIIDLSTEVIVVTLIDNLGYVILVNTDLYDRN